MMIKVEHISKSIKETPILCDITFEINKGDFIAVMGPSGSGKSTLLYSVSGLDSISEGNVVFNDTVISKMKENELSEFRLNRMGFVFQNAQMLKNLSILDNIILPGLVAKNELADVIRKHAMDLMKQMNIEGIEHRDIKEVSGGQLQRASICRALINNPDILFMDEPTGALNSTATDQVLNILEDLNKDGMTILTVTHDARVAAKAKKVIYIKDGQIASCKEFSQENERDSELNDWLKDLNELI
jgi:putative ABC transport system ATP-binding protein